MKQSIILSLLIILITTACTESDEIIESDVVSQPLSAPKSNRDVIDKLIPTLKPSQDVIGELISAPKPVIGELNKYANRLVASTKNNIFNPTVTPGESSYIIKFHTTDPKLMAEQDADKNRKAYERNIIRTTAWGIKFCTPELKSMIDEFKLSHVDGVLLDNKHKDMQAMSTCRSDSAPTIEDNLESIQRSLERLNVLRY
jgi:hypothetical protein